MQQDIYYEEDPDVTSTKFHSFSFDVERKLTKK